MLSRRLLPTVAPAALCACSIAGDGAGVSATLSEMPEWNCISAVAHNITSVEIVREESSSMGRRLTWHGLEPVGTANTILYRLDGIAYALQVTIESGVSNRYSNYSVFPRDTASAAELDRSLEESVKLATKVEKECHVVGLVSKLQRYCRVHGKPCPSPGPVA